MACPNGTTGTASRKCLNGKNGFWEKPDLSKCISKSWAKVEEVKITHSNNSVAVAETLQNFTSQKIFGGDISNVVNVMENIISINDRDNKTASKKLLKTVVQITSNLLEEKKANAWNDLPKEKRTEKAGLLLDTTDIIVKSSALNNNGSIEVIKTDQIEMKVQKVSPTNMTKIEKDDIVLPDDIFSEDRTPVTLAVVKYNGIGNLLGVPSQSNVGSKKSSNLTLNSNVLSISVFPMNTKEFKNPIVFVQQLNKRADNNTEPHCAYWEKSRKEGGFWSDEGCVTNLESSNETHVKCECYHLTNFAVLMSVTDAADNVNEIDRLVLTYITVIGISISLLALFASFFTFLLVKKIRSLRNTIHQNLCFVLFAAELLFLLGISRTEQKIGCQVIAASLHFLFLVAFFIMGLEGFVLYLMLVRVYRSRTSSEYGSLRYLIVCWVLPLVFVILNLCLDKEAYAANRTYCWLSLQQKFIWSFVSPVILVIVLNFVIFIMTLRIMAGKAKARSSVVHDLWFWSKGCSLLLCILGLTWIIGIFYVDQNTIAFAYAFCVVNSLQGLAIFFFHCLCDPRVRKAYYEFFFCVKRREASLYRSNSRSRSLSTSTRSSFLSKVTRNKFRRRHSSDKSEHAQLYSGSSTNDHSSSGKKSYLGDSSATDNSVQLVAVNGKR